MGRPNISTPSDFFDQRGRLYSGGDLPAARWRGARRYVGSQRDVMHRVPWFASCQTAPFCDQRENVQIAADGEFNPDHDDEDGTLALQEYRSQRPLTSGSSSGVSLLPPQKVRTDLDLASQEICKYLGPLQKPSAPPLAGSGHRPEYPG